MITVSIALFALAAVFGVSMAALRLRDKAIPMGLAVVHGLAAASALLLLLVAVARGNAGLTYPAVLFVVAALGGFYLLSFHLRGKKHPLALIAVHAIVAVSAFAWLVSAHWG